MTRHNTLDLGQWFILRMASAATLPVARYLDRKGFAVWTPVEHRFGRMPRTRARYEKAVPLLPSYIFAEAERIDEIVSLAVIPGNDCPNFTVFRYNGGVPLISDGELQALRDEEARVRRVFDRLIRRGTKGPLFLRGASVKLTQGIGQGLRGRVVESRGQYTLVDFPGFVQPMRVASLLLLPEPVMEEDIAA